MSVYRVSVIFCVKSTGSFERLGYTQIDTTVVIIEAAAANNVKDIVSIG